jgi:DNA-binding NtrC family response regulator
MSDKNLSARDQRATVLIVDDELLVRWAIGDHLEECGFKVLGAASADEAIAALERYEGKIELVFSDVRMAGSMDGFGLAAWIKENRPGLPVILTSGHAQADDVAQALCKHVGDIIQKPYHFEDVVARIEKSLGDRPRALRRT